ncbi:MAG: hypothetical protein P4L39_03985 [Humidesulfovibrio sp.]|nr:hypothetical protein [Humidesulfovibrio sp.]
MSSMNMTTEIPAPLLKPEVRPGFLGTFVLGLRVWAREVRRTLIRQAKLHEVRQLENRLREESALLARLDGAPGPERDLSLRQVEMLKFEIERLRREQESTEPRSAGRR